MNIEPTTISTGSEATKSIRTPEVIEAEIFALAKIATKVGLIGDEKFKNANGDLVVKRVVTSPAELLLLDKELNG